MTPFKVEKTGGLPSGNQLVLGLLGRVTYPVLGLAEPWDVVGNLYPGGITVTPYPGDLIGLSDAFALDRSWQVPLAGEICGPPLSGKVSKSGGYAWCSAVRRSRSSVSWDIFGRSTSMCLLLSSVDAVEKKKTTFSPLYT